jgi:hypothetical protein
VRVMLRPHNLVLRAVGDQPPAWQGTIRFRRHIGALMEYEIEVDGGRMLRAVALRDDTIAALGVGDRVALGVRDAAACVAFPPA